jgi:hypothetical protein
MVTYKKLALIIVNSTGMDARVLNLLNVLARKKISLTRRAFSDESNRKAFP